MLVHMACFAKVSQRVEIQVQIYLFTKPLVLGVFDLQNSRTLICHNMWLISGSIELLCLNF